MLRSKRVRQGSWRSWEAHSECSQSLTSMWMKGSRVSMPSTLLLDTRVGNKSPCFLLGSSWWWKQKPLKYFFFLSLFFALFVITHNLFLNPLGVASELSYPWCLGKLCDSGQQNPVHRSAPRGPQQLGPPGSLQTGPCRRYGLLLRKFFLFYLLQLLSLSSISCPSLSLTMLILPSP